MTGDIVLEGLACERLYFHFFFLLVRKLDVWIWAQAKGSVSQSKLWCLPHCGEGSL